MPLILQVYLLFKPGDLTKCQQNIQKCLQNYNEDTILNSIFDLEKSYNCIFWII